MGFARREAVMCLGLMTRVNSMDEECITLIRREGRQYLTGKTESRIGRRNLFSLLEIQGYACLTNKGSFKFTFISV
jgi:hypothetical protein